eukprot:1128932-Lingulodinium_polyedra.AAC.1
MALRARAPPSQVKCLRGAATRPTARGLRERGARPLMFGGFVRVAATDAMPVQTNDHLSVSGRWGPRCARA